MRLIIRLSRLNFEHETGGPFAAGVFEKISGRIVAIGVNRVVPVNMSAAHAEIVALSLAQQVIGCYDLAIDPEVPHQLVVNARPCAMCFGAIPWSGISSLVIGATGGDVEQLAGFDEGPIHPDWRTELQRRGIEVIENILRDEAAAVLRDFGRSPSPLYNSRRE
jgi:tRNA(Arg) A34 adenosine deaminase TadA